MDLHAQHRTLVIMHGEARKYGRGAIGFHWVAAALVIAMLMMGFSMTLAPLPRGIKFALYGWHEATGIIVLAVMVARLVWRVSHPPPPLSDTLRGWQRWLALATHRGFYLLLIIMPLSGWAIVSTAPWDIQIRLFGDVTVPHLPWIGDGSWRGPLNEIFDSGHEILAWIILAVVILHIAAALRHHFILRDGTISRMIPRRPGAP